MKRPIGFRYWVLTTTGLMTNQIFQWRWLHYEIVGYREIFHPLTHQTTEAAQIELVGVRDMPIADRLKYRLIQRLLNG